MQIVSTTKKVIGWDRRSWYDKARTLFKAKGALTIGLCLIPLSASTLFRIFGSDKEQDGGHHYGRTYGNIFRKYRYRSIKFLEIGIGGYNSGVGGNSLLAWRAYFPFARLVACDIASRPGMSLWRTRIYLTDQNSGCDLDRLLHCEKNFDIVIDDGSHISDHQIFSFEHLIDSVSEDGIYVIEDIQTSFWEEKFKEVNWRGRHIDSPHFPSTCVGYFLELSKYLNHMEFSQWRNVDENLVRIARQIRRISFEHNMIVIEKGRNDSPSNFALVRSRALVSPQGAGDTPPASSRTITP